MSRRSRHEAIISRESDSSIMEDHWLKQYQKSLEKGAVQPMSHSKSIFDQISAIINKKSKYPTVAEAVKDMQERSGVKAYWEKMSEGLNTLKKAEENISDIIKKYPMIKNTLENYIKDTKGNSSVPAIIEKIKGLHKFDGPENKDWDDENFVKEVSRMNLEERSKYHNNSSEYSNLGKLDHSTDGDIDPSNNQAFISLMPAKQ